MDLKAVFGQRINLREQAGVEVMQLGFQSPRDEWLEVVPCRECRAWGDALQDAAPAGDGCSAEITAVPRVEQPCRVSLLMWHFCTISCS